MAQVGCWRQVEGGAEPRSGLVIAVGQKCVQCCQPLSRQLGVDDCPVLVLFRDRSHWQNSLIIIARSCSPLVPAACWLSGTNCGDPAASRSGDLRGRPGKEVLLGIVISSLSGWLTIWGSCAHFQALRLCAQHRDAWPGSPVTDRPL
jgi:hypothetical protein